MTRNEHILQKVAEECNEIAQRVHKALAFGRKEVQRGQLLTNEERIMSEFHDLVAVMEMAGLKPRELEEWLIDAKKAKVRKYLRYAKSLGRVK